MSSTAWALVALLKPLGERSHSGGSCSIEAHSLHEDYQALPVTEIGSRGDRAINDDPERLRARAVQLFAMTLLDVEQEYADKLVAEAVELQERAAAIEEASRAPASPEGPGLPSQLQAHVHPKDDDE